MKTQKKKKEFAISNDLIRLPNRLSLNYLQILGVILSNYDWKENNDEKIRIEVDTNEIIKILSDRSNNRTYYMNEISNFVGESIIVHDLSTTKLTDQKEDGFEIYMIFPYSKITPEKSVFEVNEKLNKHIQLLKRNFTVFKIANTANFTSRFSYVLYMNLCSWNDHRINRDDPLDERKRYYTTEQLKQMFDIGENEYMIKQKNGSMKFNRGQFEQRIIKKAISEINKYTNIQVQWFKEYDGKNVSKYVFEWFRRDGIDEKTGINKL